MRAGLPKEFWSFMCDLQLFLIIGWSVSLLFVAISLVLLLSGATDQGPILMVNIVMLSPIVVVSGVILRKCQYQ